MLDGASLSPRESDLQALPEPPAAQRERRVNPRRRLFEQARFATPHSHPVPCVLTSRSPEGLQLHSREIVPVGTRLVVYRGEEGEDEALRGVVVWSRAQGSMEDPPPAMGVRLSRGEAARVVLAGGGGAQVSIPAGEEVEPISAEEALRARVAELEGFLRGSSQELASLVDGVLRAWTRDAMQRDLARARGPRPTERGAPDRLLRRAREVHDRLYDRLRALDTAGLSGAPDLDPTKARALEESVFSLQQDVFLGLSEVIYRLDRLVDHKPELRARDEARLTRARVGAEGVLGAELPVYGEICRTPAFVHDTDPRLSALLGIPRHPMQAVDLGAELDRTVRDVLDPLLGILQDAVSTNLHALLSHQQAGLTRLLAHHQQLSSALEARDAAYLDWQRDLDWCAARLRALQVQHRRVSARFQAVRRAALTGDLSRGTLALLRHLGQTHLETAQALEELVALLEEGADVGEAGATVIQQARVAAK